MSRSDPPMTPADHAALEWFVRGVDGLDADAQRAFQAWRSADPAHAAAWDRWGADWRLLDTLPAEGVRHLRGQLAADKAQAAVRNPGAESLAREASGSRGAWFSAKAPAVAPTHPQPARGRPRFGPQGATRAWGRPVAALASLCLVVVGGVLGWSHWRNQPVYLQTLATGPGQQSDVQLPDGSALRLDTRTQIGVSFWRQRREVVLPEGQAVFRVQGDAARPFDVVAGPVRITVVGTRFSVRHTPGLPGEEGVRIAVEEGRVRVARSDAPGAVLVELTAGQQVTSDAAGRLGPVAAVPAAGIAPWRDGRVSFDDTPLSQALAEFARYGTVNLVVRDPGVGALRLTGTFDPRRPDNFLRALPRTLPVELHERGGITEIVAAPSP